MDNLVSAESQNKDTLIYKATTSWNSISRYKYAFTYGYKKQLHTIMLSFEPEQFPHLIGFQYLNDLSLPYYNGKKLISMVLDGSFHQDLIEKSQNYVEMIEPRLVALCSLEEILSSPFTLFSYRPEMYGSFKTNLKADYLISSEINGISFVFLVGGNPKSLVRECICRTVFIKGERNYEENQRPYALLKKVRISLDTNTETVLFIKEGFSE